jgi:riboflavin biosynthesis pyrimidine reductase
MRVLLGRDTDDLAEHYAPPRTPWLRLNFVATVDGAVQGTDGKSGDINNAVDKRAFDTMRDLADAVVVGAGTARTEGYRPWSRTTVVVSRSGRVPPLLAGAEAGAVVLVCPGQAPGLAEGRAALGGDHVLTLGEDEVDLSALPAVLARRGLSHLLCEGGPSLARDLLAAGVVDELCATTVPRLIAGDHLRLAHGDTIDVPLELVGLLEEDGTLLARWAVRH